MPITPCQYCCSERKPVVSVRDIPKSTGQAILPSKLGLCWFSEAQMMQTDTRCLTQDLRSEEPFGVTCKTTGRDSNRSMVCYIYSEETAFPNVKRPHSQSCRVGLFFHNDNHAVRSLTSYKPRVTVEVALHVCHHGKASVEGSL